MHERVWSMCLFAFRYFHTHVHLGPYETAHKKLISTQRAIMGALPEAARRAFGAVYASGAAYTQFAGVCLLAAKSIPAAAAGRLSFSY